MKNTLKQIFSLFFFSLLIACGQESTTDQKEIIFWHSTKEAHQQELLSQIQIFNDTIGKANNFVITPVYQGAYIESTTKLRAITQNNQQKDLPDIMQMDATGVMSFLANKYSYSVEEAFNTYEDRENAMDDYLKLPLNYWKFNEIQQGMPFSTSTTLLYYNKSILDKASLEAPESLLDIEKIGAAIPKKTPDGREIFTFAHVPNSTTLANWVGQLNEGDAYLLNHENGRNRTATELIAADNGSLAVFLSQWKDLYEAGQLTNLSTNILDYFYSGQLVFFISSSSEMKNIKDTVGDTFELGVTYFPKITENSQPGASISGSGLFMFDRGLEQTKETYLFLKFLSSGDVQAALSLKSGYIPINLHAYENTTYKEMIEKDISFDIPRRQIETTNPNLVGIIIGPSGDFYVEIGNQVVYMLEEHKTVDETVASMKKNLEALLAQYEAANES